MEDGKKNDPEANGPEARWAMVLLRYLRGWNHGQLAKAARIGRSQVSTYDEGKRAIPREALEKIAAAAGFPAYLLDPLLRGLRSFRAATRGRSRAGRVFADGVSAELILLVQRAADLILEPLHAAPG